MTINCNDLILLFLSTFQIDKRNSSSSAHPKSFLVEIYDSPCVYVNY